MQVESLLHQALSIHIPISFLQEAGKMSLICVLQGATYMEIMNSGGGIHATTRRTQGCNT